MLYPAELRLHMDIGDKEHDALPHIGQKLRARRSASRRRELRLRIWKKEMQNRFCSGLAVRTRNRLEVQDPG